MNSILFVCLGNICRSPMAEGVLRHQAIQQGLRLKLDSAGTGSWHVGEPPDPRAIRCLHKHGIDISDLRARQITQDDFSRFDLILAMDSANLETLRRRFRRNVPPLLFPEYCGLRVAEIPDPYYGDEDAFERVYDLLHEGISNILAALRTHG